MMTDHLVRGVDHAAFPTFDPAGTVRFYHEVLGFPIAHTIAAMGWGPEAHPDFIHFFFDAGSGDRIAFFYYFGLERYGQGNDCYSELPGERPVFFQRSRHLAFHVESVAELETYEQRLRDSEFGCEMRVRHETVESIYTRDPNGYHIEFSCPTRELTERDTHDADLTIRALLAVVAEGEPTLQKLWGRKAELIMANAGQVTGAAS